MNRYDYVASPIGKTIAGVGRLDDVGALLGELGRQRALLVTSGTFVREAGLLNRLQNSLGARAAGVFGAVQRHSPIEVVRQALQAARELRADAVVSLGGGSSVDTAKGVVWFAETEAPELGPRPLPLVAIPSTLSGAEYTPDAGITFGSEKRVLSGNRLIASVVVLDPSVAATTPDELFLASGLNAMAHCLEGAVSVTRSPMTDAFYLHGLRLLNESLPRIKDGDASARGLAQAGAAMSVIPSCQMGLAHALVHVVGGAFKTPHAATHAIVAPAVMRFNRPVVAGQQRSIAEALGRDVRGLAPDGAAREAARAVVALRERLGLPGSLRALGVDRERLMEAAAEAPKDRYYPTNPLPLASIEQARQVLDWAWSGEIPGVTGP